MRSNRQLFADEVETFFRNSRITLFEADQKEGVIVFHNPELLGIETESKSFNQFDLSVRKDFRKFIDTDTIFKSQIGFNSTFPIVNEKGEIWVNLRTYSNVIDDRGHPIIRGFIRLVQNEGEITLSTARIALEKSIYRQNSLANVLTNFLDDRDINKSIDLLLNEVLLQFDGDRCFVIRFNIENGTQSCLHEVVGKGIAPNIKDLETIPINDTPWISQQLLSGKPVVSSNFGLLPKEADKDIEVWNKHGIKSILAFPLVSKNKTWGYMGISFIDECGDWSEFDIQWAQATSATLASCLVLHHSEEESRIRLIEQEKRHSLLSNIFRDAPFGMVVFDKDGNVIYVNDQTFMLFGADKNDKTLLINLFDNPIVSDEIKAKARKLESFNADYTLDFDKIKAVFNTSIGGIKHYSFFISPVFDDSRNLSNYITVITDRTEIVSNKDFDSILSSIGSFAKIGYVKFNANTRKGVANKQWHINWGEDESTPVDEIIGIYQYVHPDDKEKILSYFEGIQNEGKLTFSEEIRVDDKKGGWKWIHVYTIVADDNPKNLEIIAVNIDITTIKESEAALIEARDKAETIDRLKSVFLANMSHEIRTPLNAIVGFSNLMTEETGSNLSKENKYYLSIIKNNSDLLLNLISDILDLSKIEAGTFDTSYHSVDVNSLCLDIYNMHLLKVHGDVELMLDRPLPECKIRSDRNRLTQLLTNLTTNAIKFTKKGHIKIGYLVTGSEIEFYVEDTGMGVEQKNLQSIFESFVKLNDFIGGTGLGLAICKKIVEQMGGTIGAQSEQGKGSRFWFRLPYIVQVDPEIEPNKKDSAKPLFAGEKPMILVAEDNESSFILLSSILNKKFAIKWAKNGEQAVELFKKHKPKVVIMDIKMPVLDGLSAIKEIRKIDLDTPIIALTAFAFSADREKAFKAGCDEFLTKPITPETLKNTIFNVLSKKL